MKQGLLLALLLTLAACASAPLKLQGVNRSITPAMVSTNSPYTGERVVWGGIIIKTQPLQDTTQIEVLAYPLESNGEPDRQASPLGRFLIVHRGFLEPTEFSPGHWLSVVGRIGPAQMGKVGKASYRFSVIQPEQLYLWPANRRSRGTTHFNFGIGIRL